MTENLKNKKLLILGGTSATFDVVEQAVDMGLYVIVTDDKPKNVGSAKSIANEVIQISTTDYKGLVAYIDKNNVDGVFCGPSEFNIQNCLTVAEMAGLPFYCTRGQWNICTDKSVFKKYCRKHDIPTVPYLTISVNHPKIDLDNLEYPVVIKPVDSAGSRGLSVCHNAEESIRALDLALRFSKSKNVLVEKYIDNGGLVFSFRYILNNGEYYPYLTFDTYVVDPVKKKYLISAFTYLPSKFSNEFTQTIDNKIRAMFADMGLSNGTVFIQAFPYKGTILCNEMGLRLSGGVMHKFSEPLMGINDTKMMIRYALGGPMATKEDLTRIRLDHNNTVMAQLMIPLNIGIISSVTGLNEILEHKNILDFIQYYNVGDVVKPEVLGTLGQHFGRFTIRASNKEEMINLVGDIQDNLHISNRDGEDMYRMKFDVKRLKEV